MVYASPNPQVSAVKGALEPTPLWDIVMIALIALVCVCMGLESSRNGFRVSQGFLDLHSRGITAHGVIFDRWEEKISESHSYYVAYVYRVPKQGRQVFTGAVSILNSQSYHQQKVGDSVSVRYLPNKPQISALLSSYW